MNFPGIDLADDEKRVAIQVTSTATSEKIKHSLSEFVEHELYKQYDRLIVYILVEKQKTYSGTGFDEIIEGHFHFDIKRDIQDYRDLLEIVNGFQIDRAKRILDILEANIQGGIQPSELGQETYRTPRAPLAEETQGDRIDASKSMGLIYKPSGPVTQYFGTFPGKPEESTPTKPAEGQPERFPQSGGGEQLKPRLLFDESHGQDLWWYLPPTVDQGFYRLKEIAAKRFRVEFLGGEGRQLPPGRRGAHRCNGPQGKTHLEPDEIEAIQAFVKKGGGLLVLGTYTGDWHHEANLNSLIEYFGIAFNRDVVLPAGAAQDDCKDQSPQYMPDARSAVTARPVQVSSSSPAKRIWSALTRNVDQVLTLSSCSLYVEDSRAVRCWNLSPRA
jgi:hypothetical protein